MTLQNELLVKKEKLGQRAPGRARIDLIIEVTIELLKEHKPADISIAMVADHGCITRTSVYAHFNRIDEILEQIAIRFIQQTGVEVESYVRRRKPASLEQLVVLMIKAIQHYFNRPDLDQPGALARHIPFELHYLIPDFDKVAALPYHTLWHTGWNVEPLTEDDPFRTLVILQSAIFDVSIKRHRKITDAAVDRACEVAIDFITRAEARFGRTAQQSLPLARITDAASKLAAVGEPALLDLAASQLELLASTAGILSRDQHREPRTGA